MAQIGSYNSPIKIDEENNIEISKDLKVSGSLEATISTVTQPFLLVSRYFGTNPFYFNNGGFSSAASGQDYVQKFIVIYDGVVDLANAALKSSNADMVGNEYYLHLVINDVSVAYVSGTGTSDQVIEFSNLVGDATVSRLDYIEFALTGGPDLTTLLPANIGTNVSLSVVIKS